jgi:hypothetical protein
VLAVIVVHAHVLVPFYVDSFDPLLLGPIHLTLDPLLLGPLLLVPLHLTFVVILQNDMKHLKI